MKKIKNDIFDEYLKRNLKLWSRSSYPAKYQRDQIMRLASGRKQDEATKFTITDNENFMTWCLTKFFNHQNEWTINHHAALSLASYHIATNGHLVL